MKKFFSIVLAALCLSTQAYADKVTASTTLPQNGKPEHVYTMVSGNGAYVSPTTTPVEGDAANGLFAFYAVDGVDGAYYIYSHNAKQWLSYDKKASYPTGVSFIKMSDSKVEGTYFKLDNYSGDNYQISPYTTAGTAQAIYLNYFGGVGACSGKTLGLWTDNGSKDAGSRYTFAEHVIVERTYTITVPEGVVLKIAGKEYANGSTITVEGSINKSDIIVSAPAGKFAVVSVDDVNNTIIANVATLPVLPAVEKYENAWVYPKQQDNVGVANISEDNGVYVLSNKVLAAGFMKVGEALYFAGCDAMNLLAGTEPFTVAFGGGDNVPASAMTLVDVKTETLTGNATAIGGAQHYNGVQLVANYEYTYKGTKIAIVWRAVLRDGSHYLRTEMELTGVDAVDMYNIIPMIYNVDTKAAGSTPKVVGNTRGATIVSNKIFAGLETPTAYNTVGGATGEEDKWELAGTKNVSLTAASWTQVAAADVPKRVEEATGANYPNVRAYKMENVELKKNQKVEIEVKYTSGSHRLNFGGADLLASNGDIAAVDYHSGYSGGQHSNNTFSYVAPYDGTFTIRVFVEDKTEAIDASSTMTVKNYNAKEGVVINTDIVGIQGRWSRNTTLAKGETWTVGAVVGLIAQDGTEEKENIRETQKRRSFLAYSERERAVPWRVFPHYNSWYELNINRNNAAPGQEHTNFTAEDILGVMRQWKEKYYDKYGEGIAAFVIDDGWDNYGPWTFHKGFPNEMRDMSTLAKEMGAGIGAWLGPVGGYGQSGNYRRAYWNGKGGMQLSNPAYYEAYLTAANNLVCQQDGVPGYQLGSDNYVFFKFDGISAQFSAVGPDAGDTGNENAEGIIRLEQVVRKNMREDIFFNTTVGTWASPFWYQISDATWRQENDHDRIGNNSINRENWITYRDRLVYQNYVQNSPMCPINTLMTHGFILSEDGPPSGDSRDYNAVLRELRCAFVCGSGIVELYTNCDLMNSINNGKLWEDVAECVAWQKKNADVLPDAHWVGGNPWNGNKQEIYGWASWNGAKATLALRNGGNSQQTYTFTLRQALEIPANITGGIVLKKSFRVQDDLNGLTIGASIDIDQELTVTLPGSSVFAFDGIDANDYVDGWENEYEELEKDKGYVVSATTGTLYKNGTQTGQTWNNKWAFTTTQEQPVALTITTAANNIAADGENLKFFGGGAGTSTFTLTVPSGYIIKSYCFDYVTSGNNNATVTDANGNVTTSSATPQTLLVDDANSTTSQFTISGGNYGIVVSNFVVNIVENIIVDSVEPDVNFNWTTSTPWKDVAVEDYSSVVFNDNALGYGIKCIEGEVTVGGARTATVTFKYTGGSCALNVRGVEIIDYAGHIVAGDYHVGKTGSNHTNNVYTVKVAEEGTYTVRCYATFGSDDRANATNGTINVSFAKEDVTNFSHPVTFIAEYATLCLGYDAAIPAGVEAYVVSGVENGWAKLTEVKGVIPAATPVILKKVGADSAYTFAYENTDTSVDDNLLKGSIADRYVLGDAYVLGIPDGESDAALCYALLNQLNGTSFKNNANKAYLPAPEDTEEVRYYSFRFPGTTGVSEVKCENGEVKTEIFDLSGRKLERIVAPGVYIVGGRRVLVK